MLPIIIVLTLSLLLILDTGMTLWAIKNGYRETNKIMIPIVAKPYLAILFTAFEIIVASSIIIFLYRNGKVFSMFVAFFIFLAIELYAVIHGIILLSNRK